MIYALARALRLKSPGKLERLRSFFLVMGGGSYALYAIHYPICRWIVHFTPNRLLQSPLILAPVISGVVLLEYVFQPRAARWMGQGWRTTSAPPAATRPVS